MKVGDARKILRVARNDRCLVGKRNRRDFQVHRANTDACLTQTLEFRDSLCIELDNGDITVVSELTFEFAVDSNLSFRR